MYNINTIMVEYKCDRCHKSFNKKHNYDVHINRKYQCGSISQSEPKDSQDLAKLVKIKNNIIFCDDKIVHRVEPIQCNYCNQIFTLKNSLARHLNNRCKIKKEDTNKKEEIYQLLLKQMKELEENNKKQMDETNKKINELMNENLKLRKEIAKSKVINNSINNGIINNIDKQNINSNNQLNNITNNNLHINLIGHGKEDLSFITNDQMKKILNKGFKSIENLTQIIHFDKNRPENHNIYISNIKDSYIMMYDGIDWKLMNRENCLQDLYDDKSDYLVEKFEELQCKLDESTLKRFGNFLSRKDDDKIIEQTKKEIKLILYNNRKIPEETRKLLRLNDENMIE